VLTIVLSTSAPVGAVTWDTFRPIECDGIDQPGNGSTHIVEAEVTCDVDMPLDDDSHGTDTFNEADAYTWECTAGSFKNGVTNERIVTWIAPATPTKDITISVKVKDDAIIPEGDDGTRDDVARDGQAMYTYEVTVHACKADLDIGDVPDADEITVGAWMTYNGDDDNENATPDRDETGTVTGEDDLVAITLDTGPDDLNGAWVTLSATQGSSKIKVWENATKGTQVNLPKTWNMPTDTVPATLYVEGYTTSGSVRDVTLQLEYGYWMDTVTSDNINITVLDVNVKEVSFSGDNYHDVSVDTGGTYSAPHWQDNSTPLDGDANDAVDIKYPACFTRNTKMKTTVKIVGEDISEYGSPVKIKGDGPGNLDIPETTATVVGDEATITNVECPNAFANEVKRYGEADRLKIDWYIHDGSQWHPAGTSDNEVFITLADPACATDFRTVLYLATEGSSATTESACITDTWANFSGPADVHAWDETNKVYSRDLHYYDGYTGVTSAAQLLSTGNGQCHAWAELLKECLLANNVANVKRTRVNPYTGYDKFGVKNIVFDDQNPTYPNDDPWLYAESDLDIDPPPAGASGLAGQNTSTPSYKLFARHFIVHRTADSTYYDPSYGSTTTSASSYTTSGIDAWRDYVSGADHWRKRSSAPAVSVEFSDEDW